MEAMNARGEHQRLVIEREQADKKQSLVRDLFTSWSHNSGASVLCGHVWDIGSLETEHVNELSINSFNLKMRMGSHIQFYVRMYHSMLCFDLQWYHMETSLNEARESEVCLHILTIGDAVESIARAAAWG